MCRNILSSCHFRDIDKLHLHAASYQLQPAQIPPLIRLQVSILYSHVQSGRIVAAVEKYLQPHHIHFHTKDTKIRYSPIPSPSGDVNSECLSALIMEKRNVCGEKLQY